MSGLADLPWVKESFAGGDAYRVIAPHICSAVTATLNRMYGVAGDRRKFPGAQPCSVMREDLAALGREHYVVAPKTDGTRYLMLVSGSAESRDMVFMIDRSMSIWIVPLFFREPVHMSRALFDGELVYDNVRREWLYQIFDLVGCGTRYTPRDNYAKRMENARHLIQNELLPPAPGAPRPPMRVLVKRFYPTYHIDKLLADMQRDNSCRADGLIFTPVPLAVKPFRNRRVFKWKKQIDHTVDFALLYNVGISSRATANKQRLLNLSIQANTVGERIDDNQKSEESAAVSKKKTTSELCSFPHRVCVRLRADSSDAVRKLLADCAPRSDASLPATGAKQTFELAPDADLDEDSDEECNERDEREFGNFCGNENLTISPDAIDFSAFEFHLIDGDKKMAYFAKVDANVNREFLQNNAMAIANAARPMVVECAYESGVWRILLHRVDRELPNAEYTVEKTLQNIKEDISLEEIADIARNNTPPTNAARSKRARNESPAHRSARRPRHVSPASDANQLPVAQVHHPMHNIHPSRAAAMSMQRPQFAQTVEAEPPAPMQAHPMHNIHPSRLARFGARLHTATHTVAPVSAQVEEYDPCNPGMGIAKDTRAQQKADMSTLLRQLQQSIEKDPNSALYSALQKPHASGTV